MRARSRTTKLYRSSPFPPLWRCDEHPTLDAGGGLRGHRDADARHRRREHGPVAHRRGPRHGPRRPAVGRRRLHARARQRRPDRRRARRSSRTAAAVHHRARHLHARLGGLRARAGHRDAELGPRRAGHRRGDHVRGLARAARPRLPRRPRAGRRAGRVRRRDRRLVRDRPARRRAAHQRPRLAVDLPRQRPDRPVLPVDHAHVRRGVARPERARRRLARPDRAHRGPVPARARAAARQRGRVDVDRDPRRADRRRGGAGRFRADRDARARADAADAAVPRRDVHGRADRRLRDLGFVLRDLPVRDAVPAADPRPVGDRGRPRLPARHDPDADRLRCHRAARHEGAGADDDRGRPRARGRRDGRCSRWPTRPPRGGP